MSVVSIIGEGVFDLLKSGELESTTTVEPCLIWNLFIVLDKSWDINGLNKTKIFFPHKIRVQVSVLRYNF